MKHTCLSGEDLAAVVDMAPTDPVRQGCEACPRCDSLLAAMRSFLADDARIDASDRAAATLSLGSAIERISEGKSPQESSAPSTLRRMRIGRTAGWTLAAAAVFGALMVMLPSEERIADPSGNTRGGSASSSGLEVDVQSAPTSGGSPMIRWQPPEGADRYRVEFFSATLDTLGVIELGTRTELVVDRAQLGVVDSDAGLYFRVRAFRAGDPLASSPLLELPPR